MDVSVVVVSYNAAGPLERCVRSLLGQEGASFELVVVDNASSDSSPDVIASFASRLRCIRNEENVGFGRANNQALPLCRGRYVFLVNPDVVVGRGVLKEMVSFMDAHPDVGLAGTRVVEAGSREPVAPALRYPGEKGARARFADLPGEITWVIGASMFARKAVLEQVGGFDPDFFLYAEEADLCLRIRRAGHSIAVDERAEVEHEGGASESGSPSYEVWRRRERGRLTFYRKHYPAASVRRLVGRARLKAVFRLTALRMGVLIARTDEVAERKLAKYRAMRDVSNEYFAHDRATE